jgi:hypothetical protein
MAPKKIHLNFFDMVCNSAHMGIGMWKYAGSTREMESRTSRLTHRSRNPGDTQVKKDSIEYYTWLAKLAEKGKITGIFFADIYGVEDTFPWQFEKQFQSGANCAQMDPVVFVSAMAAVTKSVCFGITGSTSYINVSVPLSCRSQEVDLGSVRVPMLIRCPSLSCLLALGQVLITQRRAGWLGTSSPATLLLVQKPTASTTSPLMTSDMRRPMSIWTCVTRE